MALPTERGEAGSAKDPRDTHPNLCLGGHVINVVSRMPTAVKQAADGALKSYPTQEISEAFQSIAAFGCPAFPFRQTVVSGTGVIEMDDSTAKYTKITVNAVDQSNFARLISQQYEGRIVPVFLTKARNNKGAVLLRDQHEWHDYAQREIRPLLQNHEGQIHGKEAREAALTEATRMNEIFAEAVVSVYRPGDIVIVHGCDLCLLPSILRRQIPGMHMAFMFDTYTLTPKYTYTGDECQHMCEGILGADLIVLQSRNEVERFENLYDQLEDSRIKDIDWDRNLVVAADDRRTALKAVPRGQQTRSAATLRKSQLGSDHDLHPWALRCTDALTDIVKENRSCHHTPELGLRNLRRSFDESPCRLFVFDYDGTLTNLVDNPEAAVPSKHLLKCLDRLSNDASSFVWIVSGRTKEFLTQHFGYNTKLGLYAEHGCWVRLPGRTEWNNCSSHVKQDDWTLRVLDAFNKYVEQIPGSAIERKSVGVTLHYRNAEDQELALVAARQCHKDLHDTLVHFDDVHVMAGKMNVEVRPDSVNKGSTIKTIVENLTRDHGSPTFVMCVGDDFTDEDMFGQLRSLSEKTVSQQEIFSVSVGDENKPTLANWRVSSPEDVVDAIAVLAARVELDRLVLD